MPRKKMIFLLVCVRIQTYTTRIQIPKNESTPSVLKYNQILFFMFIQLMMYWKNLHIDLFFGSLDNIHSFSPIIRYVHHVLWLMIMFIYFLYANFFQLLLYCILNFLDNPMKISDYKCCLLLTMLFIRVWCHPNKNVITLK